MYLGVRIALCQNVPVDNTVYPQLFGPSHKTVHQIFAAFRIIIVAFFIPKVIGIDCRSNNIGTPEITVRLNSIIRYAFGTIGNIVGAEAFELHCTAGLVAQLRSFHMQATVACGI